ncbi:hypothetical protein [Klebsiella pneumoniae]|uniref:hypothetical protein n=1 Tax=Klebsiella pneumoniae TaxID=573 RepID=UPI002F96BC84
MHGNVNEICARLLDSFEPQQRISLLIWTAEDVHDCTSDMNLTDDEAEAVLAEIAECSSHSRYGVGKDTVWSLAKQVREDCGRKIKCHPNYRTLQRSNSCKNPFKTMTYFNSAICKRFVGMEAGIIKVSS